MLDDTRLASDAVAAYLGINFGDTDNGSEELRKAMNIGAITGMIMSSAMSSVSNLVHSDEENLRNTIAQLKNDGILKRIVGENFGKAQDDQHVGIFFDSFNKAGVNIERLTKSLEDLK